MHTYIREPINGLTHLGGAVLSVFGLIALIMKALETQASPIDLFAVTSFGISMILLYSASAAYHSVFASDRVIAFLRRVDHSMIYLLIAGSYTPFCLISLEGSIGKTIFIIVSSMAVLGIFFKLVWFTSPRWLSTALYIIMGWIIIFAGAPLFSVLSKNGFLLLLWGGIFYTIGGVIYAFKPKWLEFKHFGFHEIFHVFILLGSLSHFLSVYIYVL